MNYFQSLINSLNAASAASPGTIPYIHLWLRLVLQLNAIKASEQHGPSFSREGGDDTHQ